MLARFDGGSQAVGSVDHSSRMRGCAGQGGDLLFSPAAEELPQNLIRARLVYAATIIQADCEEPTVTLWTKTSRVVPGIGSKYEDELTWGCVCIEFGVLLLKNVSASVA